MYSFDSFCSTGEYLRNDEENRRDSCFPNSIMSTELTPERRRSTYIATILEQTGIAPERDEGRYR